MREGAHPPDEAIRGWAKVHPFPFVSGILKRCFSWLEPENQSCSDSICNVLTLWSSSINVQHCTWLGFFLPPAVRDSGGKTFLLHDCESRQNICQNKSFPFHREITIRCCAYLRRLVECVSIDSPVFRTLAEAERGGEGNGIPDRIRF